MSQKPTYEEVEKQIQTLEKTTIELNKIEDLLREEIFWRRILIEESRDGIVILDQYGKVYEANKHYADMLGYSIKEVHQLYVWDWDAQLPKEIILEMLRTVDDAGDNFETRHRVKMARSLM